MIEEHACKRAHWF